MNTHHVDDWGSETPDSHTPASKPIDTTDVDVLYKMAEAGRVLRNVTSAVEKRVHRAAGASELTLMHCLVLVHLSRTATCQQTDLKTAIGAAPPHLTKLLDELVHRDLVCRHRSSRDRRQIILTLTEPGRQTASRLLAALHDVIDKAQIHAIEQLGSSLERFVCASENEPFPKQEGEKD